MAKYIPTIGLEVHVQLKTASKLFCGCSTEFGAEANTHACPVCTGMPGVLPVLNKKAVEYAIKTALAAGSAIAPVSIFARKNYFYPDLPKNYQISQYEKPLAEHGSIETVFNGKRERINLVRIHLEEDAGKLLHEIGSEKIDGSLVDFNRTGIPLLEIVSEPQISSPEGAYAYLAALKNILQYLEVSDCDMEKGSLRCDANVSVRPPDRTALGVKTELKNMNSFRGVQRALEYEIRRQEGILDEGGKVEQETLLWDEKTERTCVMRTKEEAHDYRYFPEPDLVPLIITEEWEKEILKSLPELPGARRERFMRDYKLSAYDAGVLTADKALSDYYEKCVQGAKDEKVFKMTANWVTVELAGHLNAANKSVLALPVSPEMLAELIGLIENGTISGKIAKTVFEEMFGTGKDASIIVKEKKLVQITDEKEIARVVEEVMAQNPDTVAEYRKGNEKAIGHLVGEVMKKTRGKANPHIVNTILKDRLSR